MRIIAGAYRGRVIKAPKGKDTRPTTDRVRESLMSSLGSARGGFDGAIVLDAFAGSGALGLEAFSRGAASVQFCERDGAALRVLQDNVDRLGLAAPAVRIRRIDVLRNPAVRAQPPFDLVLLDPPYACPAIDVLNLVSTLRSSGSLSRQALVSYEHSATTSGQTDEAVASCGFVLASRRKYGDTVVDILKSEEGMPTP